MTANTLLAVEALEVNFGGVHAVQGASLELYKGEILGIIGPNGAGKSSLLGAVGGQLPISSGRVRLDGEDITRLRPDQRARKGLARSFQSTSEFSQLTVYENLLVAGAGRDGASLRSSLIRTAGSKAAAAELDAKTWGVLADFDMAEMANAYGRELSGGQRRLVEMMRCLMQRPKVILLDEPMVGVAPHLVSRIGDECLKIRESGVSLVIIEHALEVVERLCDRVVVMAEGQVIANGTYGDVMSTGAVRIAYLG